MDIPSLRKHPAVSALLWSIPLVALVILAGPRLGDEPGHAASHLVVALPALLLLSSVPRWRERAPKRLGSAARRIVIIGLVVLGGGQVLEAIGAFGFEGYARQYGWLATLHDVSMVLGPLGLLLLLIGGILTAVARMNQRAEGRGRIVMVALGAALFAGLLLRFAVLGA